MTDTCNATERDRGRLYVCELPLDHDKRVNHRDGEHEWTQATEIGGGPDERIFSD